MNNRRQYANNNGLRNIRPKYYVSRNYNDFGLKNNSGNNMYRNTRSNNQGGNRRSNSNINNNNNSRGFSYNLRRISNQNNQSYSNDNRRNNIRNNNNRNNINRNNNVNRVVRKRVNINDTFQNNNNKGLVSLGKRRNTRNRNNQGNKNQNQIQQGNSKRQRNTRSNNNNNKNINVNNNQILKRQEKRAVRRIENRQNIQTQKKKSEGLLYLSNLPQEAINEDLKNLFDVYGKLRRCAVFFDKQGVSTGNGVIQYTNRDNAQRAKNDLSGTFLKGKNIIVNFPVKRSKKKTSNNTENNAENNNENVDVEMKMV